MTKSELEENQHSKKLRTKRGQLSDSLHRFITDQETRRASSRPEIARILLVFESKTAFQMQTLRIFMYYDVAVFQ